MGRTPFIHQQKNWPEFTYNAELFLDQLSAIKLKQGRLLGQLSSIGFDVLNETSIEMISADIIKSFAIEGEKLNREDVRSSIGNKLGLEKRIVKSRNIDGIVDIYLDAIKNYTIPLTQERLFGWHNALFPTGYSGADKIVVANYRNHDMQVVSGAYGKMKTHFVAPDETQIEEEMKLFLEWTNTNTKTEPTIKSAICHLWFLTIHPFSDGNGRIARAIGDMQLAKADACTFRYYSITEQIEINKKEYYAILEKTQRGDLNITKWLIWYLKQIDLSLDRSEKLIKKLLIKSDFWMKHATTVLNTRQVYMINKLFDNLFGELSTSKWAKMNNCSTDTALRDIKDLLKKDILEPNSAGGRSTNYYLKVLGNTYSRKNKIQDGMSL